MASEIKRLLESIEQAELAMLRGLQGLASEVARRDFIHEKEHEIDTAYRRLCELVKEPVATALTLECMNCAFLLYEKELWIEQLRQIEADQRVIDDACLQTSTEVLLHRIIRKQPHDRAEVGDILLYRLKLSDNPVDPYRLCRGKILCIQTDERNKRDYFVESFDAPSDWFDYEKREMVYSSQVYGFEPAKKPDQQETA
jgi:hypothetical protein